MAADKRSSAEIERELESERSALVRSAESLQESFSFDGIARQVTDQVSRHSGDIGRSVGQSAKDNPIALVLTGIGLAWLISGRPARREVIRREAPLPGPHRPADHTVVGAEKKDAGGSDGPGFMARVRDSAGHLRDRASGGIAGSRRAASDRWDRLSSRARRARVRGRASAHDLRSRMHEGTEHMSETARQRVIAAREQAYRTQRDLEDRFHRGRDGALDFVQAQPLVTGAVALAAGAALAACLPRTRTEDEAMGEHSDQLFDEAERVFREEYDKAERVVESATAEARDIAGEKRDQADRAAPGDKTAGEAASDEVRTAADRVTGAAKTEAERQGLGKPKT